ncbi:MAG: hypothetical protein HZA52_08605 [Planctomycetes bacterium]|nr:hypothetical protein [Planctomycetota bacterium]
MNTEQWDVPTSSGLGGGKRRWTRSTRRAGWTAVALGFFLTACGGGGVGSSAEGAELAATVGGSGQVVAELELGAPSISGGFVLRGTVPVPKGTFPRSDGLSPFSILDFDGNVVPTQCEIVSRYPRDTDGADVVEVIGRVNTPPGTTAGTRITYSIVDSPHAIKKFHVTKPVLGMMSKPGSLLLVAKDCFGHQYTLDLVKDTRLAYSNGTVKQLRLGDAASQVRTYGVMLPTSTVPVGPPNGPLSHLFGVHAYLGNWAKSDVISLDLRVSNGFSGRDAATKNDDPINDVYFRSLELWVKKGWTIESSLPDSAQGPSYDAGKWTAFPLVTARTDGKLHLMVSQGQFNRRITVVPIGKEAEAKSYARAENLGFCKAGTAPSGQELFSWWNPATARYFPQKHRLPELDHLGLQTMRQKLGAEIAKTESRIKTGQPDAFPYPTGGAMGWAYPWGSKYGGMTGGQEIFMYDGLTTAAAASNEGWRNYEAMHRMYSDRQPTTLFNKDGEPTRVADWVIHGSLGDYIPMYFFLKLQSGNDPFGFKTQPTYQVNHVKTAALLPPYEASMRGYGAIDFQHYVRRTRSEKVLIWLGNDGIAKDDARMEAELFHLSYCEYNNDAKGNAQGSGLLGDIQSVAKKPGDGFGFGRGEGWGIDAMNVAYSIGDTKWRNEILPWYQKIADLVLAGQGSCNGFWQNMFNDKWVGGLYRARQSFEQSICENALVGAIEVALRDVDLARHQEVETSLKASLYAMIGPMGWSDTTKGPWTVTAVAPLSGGTPFCGSLPVNGTSGKPDKYYTWSSFAYGYELTGDPQFLDLAETMAGGNLLAILEGQGYTTLENRAALLALVQMGIP